MTRIANVNIISPPMPGGTGSDGAPWPTAAATGSTGTPASCSFWWDECAGWGGSGADGATGATGGVGGAGSNGGFVEIEADEFGPNVRVEARGGDGGTAGRGGPGQQGGDGGVGGDGARCEDGGFGGNAGRGGEGGPGGAGGPGGGSGQIHITTRVYDATGCDYDTSSGMPGAGGPGGPGGPGGARGANGRSASEPHVTFCGTRFWIDGNFSGNPGPTGPSGPMVGSWRPAVITILP